MTCVAAIGRGMGAVATLVALQVPALDPSEVFRAVAPAVVVVEALTVDGTLKSQGSGVLIGHGVVTNWHVVEAADAIRVRRGVRVEPAVLLWKNAERDLAQLITEFEGPYLGIRPSTTLKVGERVYAVGAPQGLELSLSEGLVAALREVGEVKLVQTTAPVSPGSSGGGLFDSRGLLIGITTFQVKDGQNLNFAIPIEWVLELGKEPTSGSRLERPQPTASPSPEDAPTLAETLNWLQANLSDAESKAGILRSWKLSHNQCSLTLAETLLLLVPAGAPRQTPATWNWTFSLNSIKSLQLAAHSSRYPNGTVVVILGSGDHPLMRGKDGAIARLEWRVGPPGSDLGPRVLKAFAHAVQLCGGEADILPPQREPF